MTIFNTNPPSGGGGSGSGFGTKAGDIYKVSKDHVNNNEYDLIFNQEQIKDGSLTPELLALSGYAGMAGLIDVEFNNKTIYSATTGDGAISINKSDGITYVFSRGNVSEGWLYKNTNNMTDISVITNLGAVGSSGQATYITACLSGDDLYLFFSSASAVYCRVLDTLTDTWKTSVTTVVSGLSSGGVYGCHNNANIGKVVVYVKNSTTQTKFLTTSDGVIFTNYNIAKKILYIAAGRNYLNNNTNGSLNYYNGKYWFYERDADELISVSETTFTHTIEESFTPTLAGATFQQLQCTENGVFWFELSADTTNHTREIVYSDDGYATRTIREVQLPELVNNSNFFLIDDVSLCLIQTSNIYFNYDLSNDVFINEAVFSSSLSNISVYKDGSYINVTLADGISNDPLNNYNFNATFSSSPLVLPPATEEDKRYKTVVKHTSD